MLSDDRSSPVLVEVMRADLVESRHHGNAAVVDADGRIVDSWGDIDRPMYPRSAFKAIQALPLVESGAADAFELDDRHLALACASHSGEPQHVGLVMEWLARIGCAVKDLECGAQRPIDQKAADSLLAAGESWTAAHNNCSGKHTGMLTTARHMGEPTSGYIDVNHPVQRRVADALEAMSGFAVSGPQRGIDGCSLPAFIMPLRALATAMARYADPSALPAPRKAAVLRIRNAWGAHPYLVAGRERFCTRIMTAVNGRFTVKTGAEGVLCASLPEQGLGIALKIGDGAGRAAGVAMAALLRRLGAIDENLYDELCRDSSCLITNLNGWKVGELRPAASLVNGP